MKNNSLSFFTILLIGITSQASVDVNSLRRQCYWSENGGIVKYDKLKKSCEGDNCIYKKFGEFHGSEFKYSENGRDAFGTGRDVNYWGNYAGFAYSEKREEIRSRCEESVESYCERKSGKVETITTKLGTFEACSWEFLPDWDDDYVKLVTVPYLPFYSFLRMETRSARYDLNSHPMFSYQLKNLPPVKVSGRCFEVLGKKYCAGSSEVVMASTMNLIDAIQGIAHPGHYWVTEVTTEKVKFQNTEVEPYRTIEINTQDLGMYIVQKKCIRGICPGAKIRIEQRHYGSSYCQYSPNGSMTEFKKEFEFVGYLGSGNNYSEVWKVIHSSSYSFSKPYYEAWPNSLDVLGRGGLGWNGGCLVTLIKK